MKFEDFKKGMVVKYTDGDGASVECRVEEVNEVTELVTLRDLYGDEALWKVTDWYLDITGNCFTKLCDPYKPGPVKWLYDDDMYKHLTLCRPFEKSGIYEAVDQPSHYDGTKGVTCIEAIENSLTVEEYKGYLKGNIMKYMWRADSKGGVEDYEKAQKHLEFLLEIL